MKLDTITTPAPTKRPNAAAISALLLCLTATPAQAQARDDWRFERIPKGDLPVPSQAFFKALEDTLTPTPSMKDACYIGPTRETQNHDALKWYSVFFNTPEGRIEYSMSRGKADLFIPTYNGQNFKAHIDFKSTHPQDASRGLAGAERDAHFHDYKKIEDRRANGNGIHTGTYDFPRNVQYRYVEYPLRNAIARLNGAFYDHMTAWRESLGKLYWNADDIPRAFPHCSKK